MIRAWVFHEWRGIFHDWRATPDGPQPWNIFQPDKKYPRTDQIVIDLCVSDHELCYKIRIMQHSCPKPLCVWDMDEGVWRWQD